MRRMKCGPVRVRGVCVCERDRFETKCSTSPTKFSKRHGREDHRTHTWCCPRVEPILVSALVSPEPALRPRLPPLARDLVRGGDEVGGLRVPLLLLPLELGVLRDVPARLLHPRHQLVAPLRVARQPRLARVRLGRLDLVEPVVAAQRVPGRGEAARTATAAPRRARARRPSPPSTPSASAPPPTGPSRSPSSARRRRAPSPSSSATPPCRRCARSEGGGAKAARRAAEG